MLVERKEYLEKLLAWKEKEIIKVVTGMRRCGKSKLLEMYQMKLIESGVDKSQIIYVNFDEFENRHLLNKDALYTYIKERLCQDKYTYIFLDEIQKVEDYEIVVDSLYVKPKVDLYITGSNSYLLSGDLATYLSGRYIEINMLPLSFKEYHALVGSDKSQAFQAFLANGGLPYVTQIQESDQMVKDYIEGVYNTVIVKDIEERQARKETETGKRKITDIALLKSISRYLADVAGNLVSIKGIADYLTSSGRKVSVNTVADYVEALVEAYVFYPVERYDIQGKLNLKQNPKYYVVDIGIKNHILSRARQDLGFTLENVVFLELIRRGYNVNIGKVGVTEVDFVARKGEDIEYYQVSATVADESAFNREKAPFEKIKDHYPKIILTGDVLGTGNINGIKVVNVIDWLLS